MSLPLSSLCSIETDPSLRPDLPIGRAPRAAAVKDAAGNAAAPAKPARSVLDRASTVLSSRRGTIAPRHCAAAAWRGHLPAPIGNRYVTFSDAANGCFLAALPGQSPVGHPPGLDLHRAPLCGVTAPHFSLDHWWGVRPHHGGIKGAGGSLSGTQKALPL